MGESEALPRDDFEVVNSALSDNCQVAEGLRCTKCGAVAQDSWNARLKGWRAEETRPGRDARR
ncbi:hypothetical protein [Streptomyces sp. Isolate_219]|uniref:hypothetical protein n=1 Tax=Streptomyces sp. Isolate_219 TaxID=2950110 RepID=UPI0021C82067|nr:hypothetical protein [Streptomyces sp. Isolate_219]MCR8575011.1 hypothetical protein [Streptomyces sp. Isolate_219]